MRIARQDEYLPRAIGTTRPTNGSLLRSVRLSAMWTAGGTVILRVANILVMILVARIVSPGELGVFALAVTAHSIIVNIAELGVASSIARSDLDVEKIAPTVSTISIAASVALASLMAVFADTIAEFMGSTEAGPAVRILSIGVALIGPLAVPGALLQREFRQQVLFWASAAALLPGSVTLIIIALLGNGAEAFAWSRIVGQITTGTVILACSSRIYIPQIKWNILKPLLAFGVPLAAANTLSQLLLNLDYLYIGRMLSTEDLGVYFLAFGIAMWPTASIGSVLNGVVVPAFSTVLRDDGDVRSAVLAGVRLVSLIAFPLGAFLFTFANSLVSAVYGPAWKAAGPVLQVLALYGVLSVIGLLLANLIIATGKTGVLFGVQLAVLVALLPALPVGIVTGGTIGVSIAHIIVIALVTTPVYLLALRRSTSIGLLDVLRALIFPALSSTIAALIAWWATSGIDNESLTLIIGALVGFIIYTALNATKIAKLLPGVALKMRGRLRVVSYSGQNLLSVMAPKRCAKVHIALVNFLRKCPAQLTKEK